jgi:hypothetical protein
MLIAAWLSAAGTAIAGEPRLTPRLARLNCGVTIVTAHASCDGATGMCLREALTFRRAEGSLTVAPHKRVISHTLPDGKRVDALDYRINAWSCVAGVNGGEYVAVSLTRTGGGSCGDCEDLRLYHPGGGLIATTLRFDAQGRPREDVRGGELIAKMIGRLPPGALQPVYTR